MRGCVLTGLADGLLDGDLTIGASALSWGSTGITGSVLTDTGLTCGFSATLGFFSVLSSSFFELINFAPVLVLGPLPITVSNGNTTGTNFLFAIVLGVSLLFITNLGVLGSLGSSVKVLSLSESISNESSALSKIPVSRVSVSLPGGSTFL